MKRLLPLLLLAGLGGVGGWRIWTSSEPGRRWGRIDELLRAHQNQDASGWSEADGESFWTLVAEFDRRDREGLRARILAAARSDDADERYRAGLLAAHLRRYAASFHATFAAFKPWRLPLPDPDRHRYEPIRPHELVARDPAAFARLADDPRPGARRALLELTDVPESPELRDAYLRIAESDADFGERGLALQGLGRRSGDPAVAKALAALTREGEIRGRFLASVALTFQGDPAGTRAFVDFLIDLDNDLCWEDRIWAVHLVTDHFVSLEELRYDITGELDAWRCWLEIREHEGFRADAQAARDQAWRDAHP